MNNNALIIFTRNPELGKVKSRLAKTIGDENALKIYKELLLHTKSETQNLDGDKFVFYDKLVIDDDIWTNEIFNKKLQSGKDLGERMQNAFQELFDLGYKNCIIVGSDLFDLKAEIISTAIQKLENMDVIIGPAEDGGYYLLGLKEMIPDIFQNKNWGTETVLEDTLEDVKNKSVEFLVTLNDIDTFEDLEKSTYYQKFKTEN